VVKTHLVFVFFGLSDYFVFWFGFGWVAGVHVLWNSDK